ncbi:uncharacterized protein SCHCODRAFT_02620946 [Schizophyllum commune H4-8]|nr:uncharacterized protein SCHCODRAFT_02620946 [Schizophyllum commune H4-8]KAI5893128.1 hypothetical protein SCHCODRAFT_02620946 [Schizophyllum commune H4-8]
MPSRFGRARGLVAEWRAGMAALLRFVRGKPERDGAAVVFCSSSSSIGTFYATRLCALADNNFLAASRRSFNARLLSSTPPPTTAPA